MPNGRVEYVVVQRPNRETDVVVGQHSAPTEEELLAQLITSHLMLEPTREQVITVHERIFNALWHQLAPLMGHGGVKTIFARAIQVASRNVPLAAEVHPTATSLDFAALRALASNEANAATLRYALTTLAIAVEHLITSLLGPGLTRALLRDAGLLLERERQISPSDTGAEESSEEEGPQE